MKKTALYCLILMSVFLSVFAGCHTTSEVSTSQEEPVQSGIISKNPHPTTSEDNPVSTFKLDPSEFTDDKLLDLVCPMEIAMAGSSEFLFDDPSQLSSEQLFLAFMVLKSPTSLEEFRDGMRDAYVLSEDVIISELERHFHEVSYSITDDCKYYSNPKYNADGDDTHIYVFPRLLPSGNRNPKVLSKDFSDNIATFSVGFYDNVQLLGTPYLTKTYQIEFYQDGYYYLSATIDSVLLAAHSESTEDSTELISEQLSDKDLLSLILQPEIALPRGQFSFRNPCELPDKTLFTLFLVWTDYSILEQYYDTQTGLFSFPQELIISSLDARLENYTFDITQCDNYNPMTGQIVVQTASGFGGDRAAQLSSTTFSGDTAILTVDFYDNYEFQGVPEYQKEYVIQFYDGGYRFLSVTFTHEFT